MTIRPMTPGFAWLGQSVQQSMRRPVDVWQGCSDDWQPAFIRAYLLPLGHAAWQGYITQGRGLVACEGGAIAAPGSDGSGDRLQFSTHYVPQQELSAFLQHHDLPAQLAEGLLEAVQTYHPGQELLVALCQDGQVEIDWLRHLAIAPPACHRQVCNRWEEFALDSSSASSSENMTLESPWRKTNNAG